MEALKAINTVIAKSGKSKMQVARDMGKSDYYVTALTGRGSVPKADTLALIAEACGYCLQLVSDDGKETITIDPAK